MISIHESIYGLDRGNVWFSLRPTFHMETDSFGIIKLKNVFEKPAENIAWMNVLLLWIWPVRKCA